MSLTQTQCAGPAEKPSDKYYKAAQLADALSRELHYTVDEKQKAVLITDDGYEAAEDVLEVSGARELVILCSCNPTKALPAS